MKRFLPTIACLCLFACGPNDEEPESSVSAASMLSGPADAFANSIRGKRIALKKDVFVDPGALEAVPWIGLATDAVTHCALAPKHADEYQPRRVRKGTVYEIDKASTDEDGSLRFELKDCGGSASVRLRCSGSKAEPYRPNEGVGFVDEDFPRLSAQLQSSDVVEYPSYAELGSGGTEPFEPTAELRAHVVGKTFRLKESTAIRFAAGSTKGVPALTYQAVRPRRTQCFLEAAFATETERSTLAGQTFRIDDVTRRWEGFTFSLTDLSGGQSDLRMKCETDVPTASAGQLAADLHASSVVDF